MTNTAGLVLEDKKGFTYKDYLLWGDDQRWEIIDGIAYNMSPAPSRKHQKISAELMRQFSNYLIDKSCEVYAAPFDVLLPEKHEPDNQVKTIVQPDISVICDRKKLDEKGCRGAPDLIIEIISPHTAKKDMKEKLFLYENHGVKEYWLVYPEEKVLMQYQLEEPGKTRYARASIFSEEDKIVPGIFQDLEIQLNFVFKD